MNYYILITALSVSIDSFFGGISLKAKGFLLKVLQVISVVFVMCIITNYFGKMLIPLLDTNTEVFGGICLILVAIYQFFCEKNDSQNGFLIGFAIGTDGACANFSLALMGYNSLLVPIVLTFFHLVFLCIGYAVTRVGKIKKLSNNFYLSPCVLIGLGLYKIIFGIIN